MKNTMNVVILSLAFVSGCADVDSRDNPTDPLADNYDPVLLETSSSFIQDVVDDSSSSTTGDESSSSVVVDDSCSSTTGDESSSSVVVGNSSSSTTSDESSSSVVVGNSSSSTTSDESSSSVVVDDSSSSITSDESSSSSAVVEPSSSSVVIEISSSSEGIICGADKPNWKYLNKSIEYGCILDSRDNQYYKTVKIGSQVWMAENLNYYSNVDPNVAAYTHCYDDNDVNCEIYGRLYTWTAAMNIAATNATNSYSAQKNHQGLCPDGFHIPTNNEIGTLLETANADDLKSMFLWKAGYTGSDKYGFSALPGGSAEYEEGTVFVYEDLEKTMSIWAAKEKIATKAYVGIIYDTEEFMVNVYASPKNGLKSVRCVQN